MKKKINIQELFKEKKFSELIHLIENGIPKLKKTSQLINILAIAKISLHGVTKKNLISVINDFQESFLIKPINNHSIYAFTYFNKYCLNFYKIDRSDDVRIFCAAKYQKSIKFYNKHENLINSNKEILYQLLEIYQFFSNIKESIKCLDKLIKNKQDDELRRSAYIYYNCLINDWDQLKLLHNTKLINKKLEKINEHKLLKLNHNREKKIKVSFLSSDIKQNHSVTHFLKSILKNYNKDKFETSLYLNMPLEWEDSTTKEFTKLVSNVQNIFKLNDQEAINLIRKDKVDIMFDIMGFTSNNRRSLFKNRVAPIQINWMGYPNTTGLDEMDYILVDQNLILANEKNLYSENILKLEKIWISHGGFSFERNKASSPFRKNNYITFGSFNNFDKINDEVIETWSQIILNNKNCKLILKSSGSGQIDEIAKKFKKYNVLDSVEFLPRAKSLEDHLNLYNRIDIALDTFPYNGTTTSFEAIWMGVPVLTLKGFNYHSRCGESINKNLGLDGLISNNIKDYISKANYFAFNKETLQELRNDIFVKAIKSPLFGTSSFSKNFYSTLEKVYEERF